MKEKILSKNTVRLRKKRLKNGAYSFYLDIYVNGCRKYEFLKLYENPVKKPEDRIENQNTRRAAEAIRSQRSIEVANKIANIQDLSDSKILLSDWIEYYRKTKKDNPRSISVYRTASYVANHLVAYAGNKVRLIDIDKNFCIGFVNYLSKASIQSRQNNKLLAKNTARLYLHTFCTILNSAVKNDIIPLNPLCKLSKEDKRPIMSPSPPRAYLTIEEIRMLAKTPCTHEHIKQAFMFACFTGLRVSDIYALVWSDFNRDNGRWFINKPMKKTQKMLYLPLSKEAISWIPDKGDAAPEDRVFHLCNNNTFINRILRVWAKNSWDN